MSCDACLDIDMGHFAAMYNHTFHFLFSLTLPVVRPSNNGVPTSNGDSLQATVPPSLEGAWPGNSGFGTSTTLQGAWLAGSGHGTIAEMLKGGTRKSTPLLSSSISGDVVPSTVPASTSLEQLSVSSMHLSGLDPVASLSFDPHTGSPGSVVKRETRFSGDVPTYGLQDAHYVQANNSNAFSVERDIASMQPTDLNLSVSMEEQAQSASGFLGGQSLSVNIADVQEGQTGLGSQFSGAPGYQPQQFVESQKGSFVLLYLHALTYILLTITKSRSFELADNATVDWGSHLITHEEDPPVEVLSESTVLDGPLSPAANLQDTSVRDSHSVIIPDHIRVSDADCTMLSFGSFDVGFDGMSANPSFIPEDKNRSFESAAVSDLSAAMRSLSTRLVWYFVQTRLLTHAFMFILQSLLIFKIAKYSGFFIEENIYLSKICDATSIAYLFARIW